VATLIPGRGNTYGYVAEVTPDDLAVLDRYEGVATGNYRRANLTVTTIEGETVQAIAYLASSTEKNAPSRAYKQAVAETIGSFWKGENGPVTESDITVRNNPRHQNPELNMCPTSNPRRRNTGESVLEILVELDKRPHSEGYVVAAASRTKAQYQVRGLTFRDTTEGSTPAIAVRFDIDTNDKRAGGSWYAVFELFKHYFTQDFGGYLSRIIGYNLSGLLRQQKSAPPGEREALAIFRQVTAEGEASPRKKAVGARAPKPVYSKAYLAAKGMKRRNPREVSVSRTLRTAPGGAWYGVIYHGGGAGGYRSPDEVAKAILGPFEKRADIPTRLGQFSDGGFIRAVKLTAPMPNWMRKLPNLDTLVATVKGMKRRNPALSQQQQRKLMQALERDARSLADMANRPGDAMLFALFDEHGNRVIDWTLDMVGGSQEDPELGMRPHPRWIIAPHAVGDDFDSMGYRFRVTAPNRAVRFARVRPNYDWDRTGEQVLIPLGPPMKKNGRGRGR
jgi:hypothetical protein